MPVINNPLSTLARLARTALPGIVLIVVSQTTVAQSNVSLPGLSAPVTVSVDSLGIPSITAANELDLSFMQGYLHAQDRFFAMDLNRRVASGTAAELFGPSVLPDDIQLRTLGLRRAAWATYTAMSADTRAWLQAYANGVNVYLDNNPLPPEYGVLLLDQVPAWSPVDTIVVGKALAFQLSFDLDINNTILAMAYQQAGAMAGFDGAALFSEDLVRSAPTDGRITVDNFLASIGGLDVPEAAGGSSSAAIESPAPASVVVGEISQTTYDLAKKYRDKIVDTPLIGPSLKRSDFVTGSNNWAVSGEVTASGNAIVANDPHLSLSFPSVFTEEHLLVPSSGLAVSGVSVPGTPGIIQGCNQSLCWGTTVNPMDVTDTFQETLRLNALGLPVASVYQGQEEEVLAVFQSYFVNNQVAGSMNSISRANVGYDEGGISFIIPRRNNGPLVEVDGDFGLSVQYTGWGPTYELEAFRRINSADSLSEFRDALQFFDVGSQNFMYADTAGNIAYFTSAENPIRADLQDDMAPDGGIPPFLIRDGSGALNHEWLAVRNPQPNQAVPFEIMPFAEMPQAVNPDDNYLANANNDPIGVTLDNNPLDQVRPGGGLYYLNPGYSDFRIGRIDRVLQDLTAQGGITVQDMIELQGNNQMVDAEVLLPQIMPVLLQAQALAGVFDCNGTPIPPDNQDQGLRFACGSPQGLLAVGLLQSWDFSSPTGIVDGFDPGDAFAVVPPSVSGAPTPIVVADTQPDQTEINNSVAATVFAAWRSQLIANSLDATLNQVGLGDFTPGNREAVSAMNNLISSFAANGGLGASGLPLLPEVLARSEELAMLSGAELNGALTQIFVNYVLGSYNDAIELLASDDFAPAFANSQDIMDYRWGRLHRIVFDHPFNSDPFNVPNGGGFIDLDGGLPGLARSGGYQVVDASTHSARADGLNEFMFGSGPARRFVGEMAPGGPQALEVIPGGRSSVVSSPNYTDQLPLWLTNSYHPLTLGSAAAAASAQQTVTFTPSGG